MVGHVNRAPTKRPRTTGKPKKTAGGQRRYDDATVTRALELYQTDGLALAARALGIPKPTITRWARAAGVDSAEVTKRNAEQTAAAAEAARIASALYVAQSKARLAYDAARIATAAGEVELELLDATRAVLSAARTAKDGKPPAELLARLEAAMSGPSLSKVVGSRTRAIHDLQLLTGDDTERAPVSDGGVTLVFATPAPRAAADGPTVIELRAADDGSGAPHGRRAIGGAG